MGTKANRKFVKDEEGISAVIAMILIVAITVGLVAVAYAWVNGLIPMGATAAKQMGTTYDGTIATNNVTFSVASADVGIFWTNINATAKNEATGIVSYVTDYLSHSPSGETEVKVGQTVYIDCPDSWSGVYTFRFLYDGNLIWMSNEVSL